MTIRHANPDDLAAANAVVEACVMGWKLPERVKRLSLASYRYKPQDLDHLTLALAQADNGEVIGVAACEPAEPDELPQNSAGLLLHGLYVSPSWQRQGIGGALVNFVMTWVEAENLDGLLVKAQVDAVGFFRGQGFELLPIVDERRDYPHRYWKSCGLST